MPNCYQLISLESKKACKLSDIDKEICEHLEVECDPTQWCWDWHNTVGFLIAMGTPLDGKNSKGLTMEEELDRVFFMSIDGDLLEDYQIEWRGQLFRIVEFLRTKYTDNAWYGDR
jgi:hypothetical protein